MDLPRTDRSLGELFSDLSQQTADLIRQEMRLAKAELSEKFSDAGRHALMIGAAVAFALTAVIAVAAATTLLMIDLGLEPWLSAAITAAVMAVIAFVLAQSGISALRKTTIAPVETMQSIKETTQWLKNETRVGASHETDEIRSEIERTRVEMSETIGQIQDKLSPDHLLKQAKDGVKEAVTEAASEKVRNIMHSAGETAHTVATRARGAGDYLAGYAGAHPIRIAITIGAVTWWMLRGRERSIDWEGVSETAWHDDGEYSYEERRSLRDKVGGIAATARDTVGGIAATARDTVGEYASTARETVGQYASTAKETAGEYAHSAREGAQRASQRVRSAAGTATTSVDDWVSENPLAAGLIAAAVGASAIGLSVPRSDVEDRAMGEARDAAWQRASKVAANIKENVSAKVADAAENFVDTNILGTTKGSTSEPMGHA